MSFVDPIWEFFLEDYDDVETGRGEKDGRSRSKKGLITKRSKRGKRIEYRDDKEDGFWDVISGAPPAATIPKRPNSIDDRNKSSKGRGLLAKKSNLITNRNSSSIRNQSNLAQAETHNNEKKINSLKKRFSRNQNQNCREDVAMSEYTIQKLGVKHTSSSDREDVKKRSAREDNDSSFDPVDLLMHINDSLEIWGEDRSMASTTDIESHDENDTEFDDGMISKCADESLLDMGSQISEEKPSKSMSQSSRRQESLLDQQLPNRTTFDPDRYPYHSSQSGKDENDYSTEIRLRVNPSGNTLSEEVYQKSTNMHEDSEQDVRKPIVWNEERYPRYRSFFDAADTFEPSHARQEVSKQPDVVSKERRNINMLVPTDGQITEESESKKYDHNSEIFVNTKKPNVLKKAVCGLKKGSNDDLIKADETENFPSSRVVVNGETHLINGLKSDPLNEVIGSKGPQSVFAYDYDSNLHMDVSYSEPNHKPRSSIIVRELGGPPPISSSSREEDIIVQIEASIISETDCIIRQGLWWRDSKPSIPNTPGINMVGKVHCTKRATGKAYGLKPMQTVVSLIKWGGNARFIKIHPKQLVKVPEGLDPAEVACLPECYLSAFQVLHMGRPGKSRYREGSMKGKSILILGCMTNNMGKAIVELALHAGVTNIYATAKKKHWETLISFGVMPLSPDPMEWIQRIAGTMDLVLAPNGNLREDVTPLYFRVLLPKYGQLILSGHRVVGSDIPIDDWKKHHQAPTLACGKNKALQKILRNCLSYDVYEEWEKSLDLCKRDMGHLLKLLGRKSIKPEVLDRIPLTKVARAHELLEAKRLPGFLVCEPWMKSKKRAVFL